jgi:hypothetical protein
MLEFNWIYRRQYELSTRRNQPSESITHPSDCVNPLNSTRTQQASLKLHSFQDVLLETSGNLQDPHNRGSNAKQGHLSTTCGYPKNQWTSDSKMSDYSINLLLFTPQEMRKISCQISNKNYHTKIYIWKSILDSSDITRWTGYHIRNLTYMAKKKKFPQLSLQQK